MSEQSKAFGRKSAQTEPAGETAGRSSRASRPARHVPLESQTDRRRAQLIRAAALVIESEGVDGLRMAEVARVAGCARQLVHGYFAGREDLLRAVAVDFDRKLQRKLDGTDDLVIDRHTFDPDRLKVWGRRMVSAVWDLVEEEGPAGVILMATPHVGGTVTDQVGQLRKRVVSHVQTVVPIRGDAEMVVELWITTLYRLAAERRAGQLSRDEGRSRLVGYCGSVLRAFAQPHGEKR